MSSFLRSTDFVKSASSFVIRSVSVTTHYGWTIFGPCIHPEVYISAWHISPDLDLIFMVLWLLNLGQVFAFRSVSLSPHMDQLYMIHAFILECTCQPGTCHMTLTSLWRSIYFSNHVFFHWLPYRLDKSCVHTYSYQICYHALIPDISSWVLSALPQLIL